MREIIINILLRILGRDSYCPLSKEATDGLLSRLANEEGFERLPDFLEQCADQFRNQFLYTKDERFRGAVLALVSLRERIKQKKGKQVLTEKEESSKIKEVY